MNTYQKLNKRIFNLKINDIKIGFDDRYRAFYLNNNGEIIYEKYYLKHKTPIDNFKNSQYRIDENFLISMNYNSKNLPSDLTLTFTPEFKLGENQLYEIVFYEESVDEHSELKLIERVINPYKDKIPRIVKKTLIDKLHE